MALSRLSIDPISSLMVMSNTSSTEHVNSQEAPTATSSVTVASTSSKTTSSSSTSTQNTTTPSPSPTSSAPAPATVPPTPQPTLASPPVTNLSPSPDQPTPLNSPTPTNPQPPNQPVNQDQPVNTQPNLLSPATSPDLTSAPPQDAPKDIPQDAPKDAPQMTVAPSFVTVTLSPTSPGGSSIVTVIQTTIRNGNAGSSSLHATSHSSSPTSPAELQHDQSNELSNGGLSGTGKIAVAVIVPLAAVTLVVLTILFIFRRRKQRKHAEELRRKEVEEYGYNPNQDPSLPVISQNEGDKPQEMQDQNVGYRGWGTTAPTSNTNTTMPFPGREGSNKLSNNANPMTEDIGVAYSEVDSPSRGTMSDTKSDNALISELNSHYNRKDQMNSMKSATNGMRSGEINRGSSNASSSYSATNRSEESGEMNGRFNNQQYNSETHEVEAPTETISGRAEMAAQPVIRDVEARRNTRIENPSHFPQQSMGISQNF